MIADLTGRNPNVFYELAIRHTVKKPVIQMIEKGEAIPFDISTTRTIQIDHRDLDSVEKAKKELERQIRAIENTPTLVESPISTAIELQQLKRGRYRKRTPEIHILSALSQSEIKTTDDFEFSMETKFSEGELTVFSLSVYLPIERVESFPKIKKAVVRYYRRIDEEGAYRHFTVDSLEVPKNFTQVETEELRNKFETWLTEFFKDFEQTLLKADINYG